MIEVYAFLAMFAVQILAMSVLFPARLIKYARHQTIGVSAERLVQLYPDVNHALATKGFFTRMRVGSAAVTVIGLFALGWLYSYMRQPGWSLGAVIALNTVYFILQFMPYLLAAWYTYKVYKTHEHSLSEGKRTATLERRRLFDFVSPTIVFLAALAYLLFVALVIIVQRESFPGFFLIGVLTLIYAVQGREVYKALYGKKRGPLDTHTFRTNRTGFVVKFNIYICIVNAAFFAFAFAIDLLDQKKWVPFAMSVLFVTITLLMSTGLTAMFRPSTVNKLEVSS